MCIGLNESPILTSIQQALLVQSAIIQYSMLGIHSFQCTLHSLVTTLDLHSLYMYELLNLLSLIPCKALLLFHPPRHYTITCTIFPIILLHLIIYFMVLHSLPHSPLFYSHFSSWNLHSARARVTIQRRFEMHTLREHSDLHP